MRRRTGTVACVIAALAALTAACGGSSNSASTPAPTTAASPDEATPTPTAATAGEGVTTNAPAAPPSVTDLGTDTTRAPVELPERIVALSEEFLLADLLALGVRPTASTSNADDRFVGIDPALTDGIEIIPTGEFNLERLAALRPDLIIAYPDYLDLVDRSTIEAIAPVAVAGDADSDWRGRLAGTAEALGIASVADDVIAGIEADLAAAAAQVNGMNVSVASITPGPLVRVFTDERSTLTELMIELGLVFSPGPGDVSSTDDNGRAELSLEQLGLLDGDAIVLLQATFIEGVDQAVAQVQASPVWPSLPGVQAGRVVVLDQLAYPGASGAARFATDLAQVLTT
jgi:iron complex transport system substrate-binding protein